MYAPIFVIWVKKAFFEIKLEGLGFSSVVECLTTKHKSMSLIPNTPKRQNTIWKLYPRKQAREKMWIHENIAL